MVATATNCTKSRSLVAIFCTGIPCESVRGWDGELEMRVTLGGREVRDVVAFIYVHPRESSKRSEERRGVGT